MRVPSDNQLNQPHRQTDGPNPDELISTRINPEIGSQNDFVRYTGAKNAIFKIRLLSDKPLQMQNNVHLCFVIKNAFNKLLYKVVLELLEKLDLFGKDVSIIHNIY